MFHKVKDVCVIRDYTLRVQFSEGVTKEYNVEQVCSRLPVFRSLLSDKKLFNEVSVDVGGYGIIWNDYFDLSCNELWEHGTVIPTPFDGFMALSDATVLWELNESTLRKAISYGKFINGIDVCKFGKQWVVSYEAMQREYGLRHEGDDENLE